MPSPRADRSGRQPRSAGDRDAVSAEPGDRVERSAVHAAPVQLEVQVRSRGLPLVADLGDLVTSVHDLAGLDAVVPHVAVDLDVAVGVLDVDGVAVAGRGAGLEHDAV